MEEQVQDINTVICSLLNERRRLELEAAGVSPTLLDGDLYKTLRNVKQQVNYRDKVIEEKQQIISEKDKKIKELEVELEKFKLLSGKLSRPIASSNNSSLPSSKNPIGIKHTRSLREKSDKKVGGQCGHQGQTRLQTEEPDFTEICQLPKLCPICGKPLDECHQTIGERRQLIDLPDIIVPFIKEYIGLQTTCDCGHKIKSEFPSEVTGTVCFGPIIESTIAYLSTRQDIPFKRLGELMSNLFGVDICQGTISKILKRMRSKAQVPYEKIRKEVERGNVVGCDETGANVNGKNEWLWSFQTNVAVYLAMNDGRGQLDIDRHFPDGFPNSTLVTDRLAAYFNVTSKDHQICLAHLLRNTKYIEEYFPELDWPKRMMQLFRDSIHERKYNDKEIIIDKKYKARFDELIDEVVDVGDKEKQKVIDTFRKGLYKHRENIFTFLTNPLVPYDNNESERSLRPAKTKIKVSGQFKTMEGAQTYATLLSIIQTAQKNNQNPLNALLAVANYRES